MRLAAKLLRRTGLVRSLGQAVIALAVLMGVALVARADEASISQAEEDVQIHGPCHTRPGSDALGDSGDKESGGDASESWWKSLRAIGDWGGILPWLSERGVTLEVQYSADFLHNTYGGLTTGDAHAFRGLLDVGLTLDTEKMDLWEGGTFFIDFQQIHGRDISEHYVGDIQALNNADAPDRTQVAEYWYEQRLLDGKLRTKLGKMDANADFAYVDYGLEFIHSSAGFMPTIPLPSYPDGALGALLFVEPTDWLYVGAGVYDAEGVGSRWGFESAFHGRDDVFTILELGIRPVFTLAGQQLPGTYRVGGWYHNGRWDVIAEDSDENIDDSDETRSPSLHLSNAGLYLGFDQLLFRENPDSEDDEQGLGAFFQFGYAPPAYNEISQYYGAGLQYTGLIPARDEDVTGIGMFHASLSGRVQSLEGRFSETAVELFYKWQLAPFLSVKPELQYLVNPGGDGREALVVGARVELSL